MFRKAERKQVKLRLGITGPSGSGKTMGALYIAAGLGGSVAMIDTEGGKGELYAKMPELPDGYWHDRLNAPFTTERYLAKMKEAEKLNPNVLILDSGSHLWEGSGGLLELHDKETERTHNSFTAWNPVTPIYRKFVDAVIQYPCHVIMTMRSKVDYVITTDGGRSSVRKVGMTPIQRPGLEYELTAVLDVDMNHVANFTTGTNRIPAFDKRTFTITPDTGKEILEWLNEGIDPIQSMEPTFKGFMAEINGLEQGNLDKLREWWAYRKELVEGLPDTYKQQILQVLTRKKEKITDESNSPGSVGAIRIQHHLMKNPACALAGPPGKGGEKNEFSNA